MPLIHPVHRCINAICYSYSMQFAFILPHTFPFSTPKSEHGITNIDQPKTLYVQFKSEEECSITGHRRRTQAFHVNNFARPGRAPDLSLIHI